MTLEGAPKPPARIVRSNLKKRLGLCFFVTGISHDCTGTEVRVGMQLAGEIAVVSATPIHKEKAPAPEGGGRELGGRAA